VSLDAGFGGVNLNSSSEGGTVRSRAGRMSENHGWA
jgi:hypothetical protein